MSLCNVHLKWHIIDTASSAKYSTKDATKIVGSPFMVFDRGCRCITFALQMTHTPLLMLQSKPMLKHNANRMVCELCTELVNENLLFSLLLFVDAKPHSECSSALVWVWFCVLQVLDTHKFGTVANEVVCVCCCSLYSFIYSRLSWTTRFASSSASLSSSRFSLQLRFYSISIS